LPCRASTTAPGAPAATSWSSARCTCDGVDAVLRGVVEAAGPTSASARTAIDAQPVASVPARIVARLVTMVLANEFMIPRSRLEVDAKGLESGGQWRAWR